MSEINFKSRPIRGHAAASEYLDRVWGLKRSRATLCKYVTLGAPSGAEAPKFFKAGRDVLYPPEALDAYARSVIRDPRAAA
ncbi:MAG TPA: hypothetical protein VHL31_24445 [Geminicoccus sp.]|jgi:hypothetical protein|uniref:hypothetical protein n=1 Tax=Geminicoccus sp. TaxID=2024832 RepID=UPI002E309653|nr:hypothetical protein [Geminicoccus sp.]HEX2529429.1 hypothetical protein [Geminicoccus sp.]